MRHLVGRLTLRGETLCKQTRPTPIRSFKMKTKTEKKKQIDKFREAARELETDDSEEAFDHVLKRVAKAPSSTDAEEPKKK